MSETKVVAEGGACRNCLHSDPHNGPAGTVDDACTHPNCDCGYFEPVAEGEADLRRALDALTVAFIQIHAHHAEDWLEDVSFADCTTVKCQRSRELLASFQSRAAIPSVAAESTQEAAIALLDKWLRELPKGDPDDTFGQRLRELIDENRLSDRKFWPDGAAGSGEGGEGDLTTAKAIVAEYGSDEVCRVGRVLASDIFKALTTARSQGFTAGYERAREDAAKEGDRFLERLKGRSEDRSDGAFVAITRLVRNIRALPAVPSREGQE